MAAERSVLHVLPHPGGGGETYVDTLEEMRGYRFSRFSLARSSEPGSLDVAGGAVGAARLAFRHDLLHVHGEVAAGLCLPLLALRPSIVTLHGLHLARRVGGSRRAAAVASLRLVLLAADCTICVSQAEHGHLARLVGPRAARLAVVVRNGVHVPPVPDEAARSAGRAQLGIEGSKPVAIWVGSLDERKDPLTAIRASKGAGVTLLVVGDGPLRQEVERAAGRRVRVLGSRADVSRLLAAADIYLLTSRREGLALALLEAMAHGLPCVVTDLAENVEAVGDAGIAVRLDDERALTEGLRRLARSGDERRALGGRARQRCASLFDAGEMIARTHAVYDRVHPRSDVAADREQHARADL